MKLKLLNAKKVPFAQFVFRHFTVHVKDISTLPGGRRNENTLY